MPRDVSLSDSKCWNGGHAWVTQHNTPLLPQTVTESQANMDPQLERQVETIRNLVDSYMKVRKNVAFF